MNTQFGRAPVADPNGTESEVFAQGGGGGGISGSTRMNTAALGGANTSRINPTPAAPAPAKGIDPASPMQAITPHLSGIGTHLQAVTKAISGNKSLAPAIQKHVANIQNSVKQIQRHVSNPKIQSEADAGDMSGYDPTGGLGNKQYGRVTSGQ